MATTIVSGTVSRVFASKGFSLKEEFPKRDGGTFTRYWNVFVKDGEPVGVGEGDAVKVSGLLNTEVSKRDARYVDHKLGNAKVEVTSAAAPAAADPWHSTPAWETTAVNEETPF